MLVRSHSTNAAARSSPFGWGGELVVRVRGRSRTTWPTKTERAPDATEWIAGMLVRLHSTNTAAHRSAGRVGGVRTEMTRLIKTRTGCL